MLCEHVFAQTANVLKHDIYNARHTKWIQSLWCMKAVEKQTLNTNHWTTAAEESLMLDDIFKSYLYTNGWAVRGCLVINGNWKNLYPYGIECEWRGKFTYPHTAWISFSNEQSNCALWLMYGAKHIAYVLSTIMGHVLTLCHLPCATTFMVCCCFVVVVVCIVPQYAAVRAKEQEYLPSAIQFDNDDVSKKWFLLVHAKESLRCVPVS